MGDDVLLILPFLPKQVEHYGLLVLVRIWSRQGIDYGCVEQSQYEIPVGLCVSKSMWIVYQSVYDILVRERHVGCGVILDIDQDFLDYLVRQDVVLVVAYQKLWIHREDVHKALYALWQKLI